MALELGTFSTEDLIGLLQPSKIEQVVGRRLTWRTYQDADEMMSWDLTAYNTCIATHVHRASRALPWDKNPMRFWHAYRDRRDFARKVGYRHNQAAVVATLENDPEVVVTKLYIAAANDDAIYLQEIVLADPSRRPERPLGDDQEYAGLGNGIFREILANIRKLAVDHQRDKVILYAVDSARAALFARRGFSLDLSEPDLIERSRFNGMQIPMVSKA